MFGFHPLHWLLFGTFGWLIHLLPLLIVLAALYWVIRLAIRHGNRDSRKS